MKARRVQFTKTAINHIEREREWWLENRDGLCSSRNSRAPSRFWHCSQARELLTVTLRSTICGASIFESSAATCTARSVTTL